MTLYQPPPSEQVYNCCVPLKYYGYSLADYFAARFPYLGREEWTQKILGGNVTVNARPEPPDYVLQPHDRIVTRMGLRSEPPADRRLEIIYEDARIRAFNKKAPIPVHPCGRYFTNSMTEVLKIAYPDETPRPAQRLDATTTGALVFAKTRETATALSKLFSQNKVRKEYLALVEGAPREKRFSVDVPIGKIRGSARGTGPDALKPQSAQTDVEWLATLNGLSLLKVVPKTGRTNQIRVHLAHCGLPIVNDAVYGNAEEAEDEGTESFQYGLHAHLLEFDSPDEWPVLTAQAPEHFLPFLKAV